MEAIRLLSIVVIWIACCDFSRGEQAVPLAWDPVPETNVVGYFIRYGEVRGSYYTKIDVANQTTFTVRGLRDGLTYYFVVTAYDRDRLESDWSNEVEYSVPVPRTSLQVHIESNWVVRIKFPVVLGQAYELQSTRDFQNWTPLWRTLGDTNGWAEIRLKYVGTAISDR